MTSVPVLAGGPFGPENNNEGYYVDWQQDVLAFTPQQRSDVNPKHDKQIKVLNVTVKGVKLSACAKTILREFLEMRLSRLREPTRLLDGIRLHSGIPNVVKEYATIKPRTFTYGNNVYLADGLSPTCLDNFEGLTLLAHEYMHSLQADIYGPEPVFAALYLAKSATAAASAKMLTRTMHSRWRLVQLTAIFGSG